MGDIAVYSSGYKPMIAKIEAYKEAVEYLNRKIRGMQSRCCHMRKRHRVYSIGKYEQRKLIECADCGKFIDVSSGLIAEWDGTDKEWITEE